MLEKSFTDCTSPFWTAKEAARYLKISPTTLYAYCYPKKPKNSKRARVATMPPPFRRIGRGLIRFPIAEFKAWANQLDYPA